MSHKKTKILYVITKSDVGGAQKYVTDLITNLDQEKFETAIIAGKEGDALTRAVTSRWLSNSFRPYFLFLNDILAVIELFFIFQKEKPDVIHLNSSKAGVVGALAAWLYKKTVQPTTHNLKPKTIFTAHGWVFNPDNDLFWPLRQFYILLHKIAARFQDLIINVSEYDRRLAIKYKIAPTEKLITIYNGLDLKRTLFLDKTAARKKLAKLLEIGNSKLEINGTWVGSIGRLVKEKNYETFIKAAALIEKPEIKFFIIGGGYEKKHLQLLIKNLNLTEKFFIVENVAPAAPFLKAFDIFVLSSIKEGLPYTLLEAMAAGVPAIVTRVGGMPEITEGNGLVVLPKEPEELARAINYFLENSSRAYSLADQAQKNTKTELGIDKMVRKTSELYLGLL